MNAGTSGKTDRASAAVRAEAAAWVARLHGPNRTPEVEAGLRRWLTEDPARVAAFEHLTDTWEKSVRLRRRPVEHVKSWELPGFRISFSRAALVTLAIAALAVMGTVLFLHTDAVSTAVGEQRMFALEDGTRIYLNTNSRAIVSYDRRNRRVELQKGEALFEVAKRPDWPFIVIAGDRQVRALGTAFVVRRDDQRLAVTLVEGKVTVSPVDRGTDRRREHTVAQLPGSSVESGGGAGNALPESSKTADLSSSDRSGTAGPPNDRAYPAGTAEVFTLLPGQRLTLASNRDPHLDQPSIESVTAWQRGQVAFDDTTLADAVAEMNRYSNARIVIEDAAAASIRVSGIFRTGDSENFAQAVAKVYGLRVTSGPEQIVLFGAPIQARSRP